jgi:methionyl aminopeptidase
MNRQSAQREPSHDPSVIIHGADDFAAMRAAGRLAAELLDFITPYVVPGVATGELDRLCEQYTRDRGGISAPLGYKGFPKSVCISINHVVCHGIPGERKLIDGDIVNIDVTPTVDGWHGDASRMYLVGDKVPLRARKLVDVTYDAMMRGIAVIKPGATLGDIGFAIQSFVEPNRFSVVRDFCGHGTGRVFHVSPSVLHYGRPHEGLVLKAGMIFTVEPMVNAGRHEVKVLDDGWTAVTRDRSLSAQFEHTVGVTETGVEIFTLSPAGFTKPPYVTLLA